MKAALIPAGDAWRAAWGADSGLQLYGPDGFHPSPIGTYLAALVAYEQIFSAPSPAVPVPAAAQPVAEILRRVAHDTVVALTSHTRITRDAIGPAVGGERPETMTAEDVVRSQNGRRVAHRPCRAPRRRGAGGVLRGSHPPRPASAPRAMRNAECDMSRPRSMLRTVQFGATAAGCAPRR